MVYSNVVYFFAVHWKRQAAKVHMEHGCSAARSRLNCEVAKMEPWFGWSSDRNAVPSRL